MKKWHSRWELVVQDTSPESLLNALIQMDVALTAPQPLDAVTIAFSVPYRDIARVRGLLNARGSDIRVCRPKGSRPVLLRLSRRHVLLGCLLIWMALLAVSNLFVWRMEVSGNETVPTGVILRCLDDAGAGIGSFWPGYDSEALRNRLLLEIPELHWAGINYKSGAVEIIVRERQEPPEVIDNEEPVHVTAAKSGMITDMSVKQGQSLVGVGDTVTEGQVLISGAAQSTMGTVRQVHALGSVTARTWYTITARQPAVETGKRYTGEKTWKFSLILGANRLNFYSGSSISQGTCDKIIMDYHLCMEGVFTLPVRIVAEQCVYWTAAERELSAEAQEETARSVLLDTLEQRMGDEGTVTITNFAAAPRTGGMTVTMMAECIEEIGERTPMSEDELRLDNTLGDETTND